MISPLDPDGFNRLHPSVFFSESLKLQRNVENYEILKQGKPLQYDSLDDKMDFQVTRVSIYVPTFNSSFPSFQGY